MAEIYAGYMEHTDAQIGRLVDALERTGQLDQTLIFVFIGDNGSSGEGSLQGLFNEQSVGNLVGESLQKNLERIDKFGQPGSYNHYPVGWALAGNAPFKLCKQYTHFGGTRNPLIVHWPKGIAAKGQIRAQFHHVIDIVPTILDCIGVEPPKFVNTVQQESIEGYSMRYSFEDMTAPTNHAVQYFEMLGNRGLIQGNWKVVTYHGRKPWENTSAWSFDQDHWELYDLEKDPAETHDLMKARDKSKLDDPIVKRCLDLVTLWWAEAGRYQVLPLDDRFQVRALGRELLYAGREHMTFYEGSVRIQPFEAPQTINRSWALRAEVVIPEGGAEGPIAVMGGTGSGWSVYLKNGAPSFCYNFSGDEYTYLRARKPLSAGQHVVRYEFEKTGKQPLGAGGTARLFVDDELVAEGEIKRTCPIAYTLDETFDIGWDKGTPVSEEYGPIAKFTGKIVRVDFDLHPDFSEEASDPAKQAERGFAHAMLRQ